MEEVTLYIMLLLSRKFYGFTFYGWDPIKLKNVEKSSQITYKSTTQDDFEQAKTKKLTTNSSNLPKSLHHLSKNFS